MKLSSYLLMSLICIAIVQVSCTSHSFNVKLATSTDSVSYYTGSYLISEGYMYGIESINKEVFIAGLKKGISDKSTTYNKAEVNAYIEYNMNVIQENYMGSLAQKGQSFLAINKTHKNINMSKTGLQYEKLSGKEGLMPIKSNRVIINYKGYTIDNKVFQLNAYNNPDTLLLSETIPGFSEGVQLMTEGSKYKFYIPTEIAYGSMPPPNTPIKPMMPVIFEVELIKVIK